MAWHRGRAYTQDLRERVLAASGTMAEVAFRFNVSESYVAKVRARRRRLGQDTPGVQCNHMPRKLAGLEQELADRVTALPDQTLEQLCEWANNTHGVQVGVTTMWKTLDRLGLSFKKKRYMPRSSSAQT